MGKYRFKFLGDYPRRFSVSGFPIELDAAELAYRAYARDGFHVRFQSRIGYAVECRGGRVSGVVESEPAGPTGLETHPPSTERGARRSVEPGPTNSSGSVVAVRDTDVTVRSAG